MKRIAVLLAWAACWSASFVAAEELVLWESGKSDYQLVLPDGGPSPAIVESLRQTARLLQTAFRANGAEIAVVEESARDVAKPAIFLGDTRFARRHGVDVSKLRDWSYRQRVVGRDVILAGRDHPARGETTDRRRPNWDRVATAKAVVDFARQRLGVRFLYPELPPYTPLTGAARIDLAATPAIEYLKSAKATVPADLDVEHRPPLRVNTSHPAGGGFYDLAHNRFPRVDEVFGGHTWERAAPAELFAEHPEYFALVNGVRLKPAGGNAQYCLANADFRERVYRDLAGWFERGYESVDLGQPDGFQPCQCADCEKLYGTGKDWSEKIWIFHRDTAERLEKSHPGRQVTMMSYILTAAPPKSFRAFPANTSVMLTGTNEEDVAPWLDVEVPRGFTGYVYNWCPNLGTRYTPMRTPGYVELQVKRLAATKVQALYRDGPGQLFGLEGPVYYVMGRMFDDPEKNAARTLLPEFLAGAFPEPSVAFSMRAFYDELYDAIALYSNHLGTRCDVWTYQPLPGEGRPRKSVTDPFRLMAFLYPPTVMANLESHLSQAERAAKDAKTAVRLALVRTEFDYLRHFVRVVHLHQAYQVEPDPGALDRLLVAIAARNAFLETLYEPGRQKEWSQVLFPFPGHDIRHLRLAYDGYQEPYANSCFNWDVKAMRESPAPSKRRMKALRAQAAVTLDSRDWESADAQQLTLVPPLQALPRRTTVRLLYDETALHVRVDAELGADSPTQFPPFERDRRPTDVESFDVYLAPRPARDEFYRFMTGADGRSKYDAASGFVTDPLDPRFGKDDPAWNADWTSEARMESTGEAKLWIARIAIPFKSLNVERPEAGRTWRANFGRCHQLPRGKTDRSIWSSTIGGRSMDDRALFGEIVFE